MEVRLEKPGTPAELVHHGVKGMKWGVRNRYLHRVSTTAARNRRVAEGKGSLSDKLQTGLTATIFTTGQKGTMRRAVSAEQHVARIRAGKPTTLDILRYAGGVRMTDLVRRAPA